MRTIEDFSGTKQAQRHLSVRRICRSTLSDFHRLATPERLGPLIASLRAAVDRRIVGPRSPEGMEKLLQQVLAVDGTFLPAASQLGVHRALLYNEGNGRIEKFRPYGIPPEDWIAEVVQSLEKKT